MAVFYRFARMALPLSAAVLFVTSVAQADDIGDAINDAQTHYKAGEMSAAKQSLDLASQLIAQQTADALTAALPKALAGWKAGDPDTTASGGFGFAITQATNNYTNAKGDEVQVAISADSPLLSQLVSAMSNPQLAGLMGKLVTVGSTRAIQTKDGEVNMLVANRFVIDVTGGGTADDKLNYAKGVDVGVLSKMK
jgi:hypothetical protein